MVKNPAGIVHRRDRRVEVWARYAGYCKQLRWVYLIKGRNIALLLSQELESVIENALWKIINIDSFSHRRGNGLRRCRNRQIGIYLVPK